MNGRRLLLLSDDAAAPPPAPSGLVEAIDVSSNNGLDIVPLIDRYRPDVVIVKAYQSVERGLDRYTLAQAKTARKAGKVVLFYFWVYGSIDGAGQAASALDAIRRTGIAPPIVFADAETYTDGTYPTIGTITDAVREVERQGFKCGVYTGEWFWRGYLGNPTTLRDRPLWDANYTGVPGLVPPAYGGWDLAHLAGTQWSGNPVDRSTFKAAFATEVAA